MWRFNKTPCFQDLDWTGSAELAGQLPSLDPQRCAEEKHIGPVSAWAHIQRERDREIKQDKYTHARRKTGKYIGRKLTRLKVISFQPTLQLDNVHAV